MLPAAVIFALAPALVILVLGVVARLASRQRVRGEVVQYAPERDSTVLRDALLAGADRRAVPAALIDLVVKRKIRLAASGERRPVGAAIVDGAVFTPEELSVLEVLFGADHTPGRLRRLSADRRALGLRVRALLRYTEDALARDGLVAERRVAWPGTTLTVLAYLGMLVEALFLVWLLAVTFDPAALLVTLAAVALTIVTVVVTPASWRRYLPAALPRRTHLDGLRAYLRLAESDRLAVLQSPTGADLRDDPDLVSAVSAHPEDLGPTTWGTDGADAPVARFHLHERLLPYAILFGLERQWVETLRIEAAAETPDPLTAGALLDATTNIADVVEFAGNAVGLLAELGDLVDGTGAVVDAAGGFFEALSP